MGILYYAVNLEKKTAYALNKGNWPELDGSTAEGMRQRVEHAHKGGFIKGGISEWAKDYDRWAKELEAYVPFQVFSDSETESSKFDGVKITGGRFEWDNEVGSYLGSVPYTQIK